jgi:hypothetical protein
MGRRPFRWSFSLKSLLVFVTFAAIVVYLIRDKYNSARSFDATAQLTRDGCTVLLGCQSPPGTAPESAYQEVVHVSLDMNVFSFKDVINSSFYRSAFQAYRRPSANAADLTVLPQLHKLRVLDVGSRRLTDDDLAHIGDLPLLKVLIARNAGGVTDAGLLHISALTDLRLLELPYARITDDGLAALGNLANLESLSLHGTPLTGSGLEHLSKLSRLRRLNIGRTLAGDLTIAGLRHLKSLEHLTFSNTGITDAALPGLQSLGKLSYLDVSATDVTFEALERLREKYPSGISITQ